MYETTNDDRPIVNGKQEPAQLKIEIPANRYFSQGRVGASPDLIAYADMTCYASKEYH